MLSSRYLTQRCLEMFYDASCHTVPEVPKKQEAHDAISGIRIAITSQYASFRRDANISFFFFNSEHLEHYLSNAVSCLYFSALPLTPLLCLWLTNILTAASHSRVGQGHPFNPITSLFRGTRNQIKCCFYPFLCLCLCALKLRSQGGTLTACVVILD